MKFLIIGAGALLAIASIVAARQPEQQTIITRDLSGHYSCVFNDKEIKRMRSFAEISATPEDTADEILQRQLQTTCNLRGLERDKR